LNYNEKKSCTKILESWARCGTPNAKVAIELWKVMQ